jgi:hypothetical protein
MRPLAKLAQIVEEIDPGFRERAEALVRPGGVEAVLCGRLDVQNGVITPKPAEVMRWLLAGPAGRYARQCEETRRTAIDRFLERWKAGEFVIKALNRLTFKDVEVPCALAGDKKLVFGFAADEIWLDGKAVFGAAQVVDNIIISKKGERRRGRPKNTASITALEKMRAMPRSELDGMGQAAGAVHFGLSDTTFRDLRKEVLKETPKDAASGN